MDEATSNIDPQTDEIIQKIISTKLEDTTVLAIAHRLNTVITYDRLLVFDNGKIVEQGSPLELLEKEEGSYFRSLVMEGGKGFYEDMKKKAKDGKIDEL